MGLPALAGEWEIKRRVVALDAITPAQIAPADPTRWLLCVSTVILATVRVSAHGFQGAFADNGFIVTAGGLGETWKYTDWGHMVQWEWLGLLDAGAGNVQVYEVLYRG